MRPRIPTPAPKRCDVPALGPVPPSRSGNVSQTLPPSVPRRTHRERWSVYLLRNERNALYTGATNDLTKRLHAHKHKLAKGAKFTKTCKTLELVYHCEVGPRSLALRIEAGIKRLTKPQKEVLVASQPDQRQLLILTGTAQGVRSKEVKRST